MAKNSVKLYAGDEAVNVTPGGEDEALWRARGYVAADEADEPDAPGADDEWPLKSSPQEYIDRYAEADEDEISDAVMERLAQARRLVGG